MKLHYTAESLLKKFKGRYIQVYPYHYEKRNDSGKWITTYEVQGVSKTLKENYNLPEDCLID